MSFDYTTALAALLKAHPERAVSAVETIIDILPVAGTDYSDMSSDTIATTLLEALTDDSVTVEAREGE